MDGVTVTVTGGIFAILKVVVAFVQGVVLALWQVLSYIDVPVVLSFATLVVERAKDMIGTAVGFVRI